MAVSGYKEHWLTTIYIYTRFCNGSGVSGNGFLGVFKYGGIELYYRYSKLWKTKRFNEMCVLGGGEISGSRRDVASSWCLSCLWFLQLMVDHEFFMDTMQMVVAIPLCFGSFSFVIMELYITERCPVVLGQLGRRWWCSSDWVGICGSLCCARFIQTPTNTGSIL